MRKTMFLMFWSNPPQHLIGYFTPYEGSTSTAYRIYSLKSLADYEDYRSRLAADRLGRKNYEFAKRES